MTERRLNTVLYFVLAAVVLCYLEANVLLKRPAVVLLNEDSRTTGIRTGNDFGTQESLLEAVSSVELQLTAEEERKILPVGFHIYVDLDLTKMYVYKDGSLLKTYDVSGGKSSSPSPEGTWRIISKDTWGEGFGGAWLGFNVPWGMYGIHGTTEPWSVGKTNTSKGCIRMKNEDVRELFQLVPHNTVVTIIQKNKTFHPLKDGDVGSDVLDIERALKRLGYYGGSEDGIFGESLKNSVKRFQKDNGLYRTGIVNISTYERIQQLDQLLED